MRGLLCFFCNSSIGTFEFDKTTARRASEYLLAIANSISAPAKPEPTRIYDSQGDLPF